MGPERVGGQARNRLFLLVLLPLLLILFMVLRTNLIRLLCLNRKKTYTGLLNNYFSYTAPSYKIGLVRAFLYRTKNQQHLGGLSQWRVGTVWTCGLSVPSHALAVHLSRTVSTDRTFIHTAGQVRNSFPDNAVGVITENSAEPFKDRVHEHLLSSVWVFGLCTPVFFLL